MHQKQYTQPQNNPSLSMQLCQPAAVVGPACCCCCCRAGPLDRGPHRPPHAGSRQAARSPDSKPGLSQQRSRGSCHGVGFASARCCCCCRCGSCLVAARGCCARLRERVQLLPWGADKLGSAGCTPNLLGTCSRLACSAAAPMGLWGGVTFVLWLQPSPPPKWCRGVWARVLSPEGTCRRFA